MDESEEDRKEDTNQEDGQASQLKKEKHSKKAKRVKTAWHIPRTDLVHNRNSFKMKT